MYPSFGPDIWLTPYGLMLALALLAALLLARRLALHSGIEASHVDLALPLVFAAALAGARLFNTLLPADTAIAGLQGEGPGRFRVFGLLALGLPALWLYCRLARIPFPKTADLFAIPALAALAIVRLGCVLAGCCWGKPLSAGSDAQADWHWLTHLGLEFPAGSFAHRQQVALHLIPAGAQDALPVHAVQLYEAALLMALIALLRWADATRPMRAGATALWALCGYAMIRFVLEFVRADTSPALGPLTPQQGASLALLLATVAGLSWLTSSRR